MYLITLQLTGPTGALLDARILTELIDSYSGPVDRVEHLRVHCAPGRADLALFLLADDPSAADRAARGVCRRSLERTPWLAGWQLRDR
ncbi:MULTISPECIES: hypothetical protein [Kitasatospora]|uniref:hypothetical protein n=1 Tax=Kitasatospora TaxID=2063 RepID=UPI000C7028BD|nr:hypothetical protein [Kitasatospora sp. GP30]MDH6142983.1 hypothetical protein [Kitasatospora sp. GP30]